MGGGRGGVMAWHEIRRSGGGSGIETRLCTISYEENPSRCGCGSARNPGWLYSVLFAFHLIHSFGFRFDSASFSLVGRRPVVASWYWKYLHAICNISDDDGVSQLEPNSHVDNINLSKVILNCSSGFQPSRRPAAAYAAMQRKTPVTHHFIIIAVAQTDCPGMVWPPRRHNRHRKFSAFSAHRRHQQQSATTR